MDYYMHQPNKKVVELRYDYIPPLSDGHEVFPEDYALVKITDERIEAILEHEPQVEGDKWFYDIVYTNGTVIRTFNPNQVIYSID